MIFFNNFMFKIPTFSNLLIPLIHLTCMTLRSTLLTKRSQTQKMENCIVLIFYLLGITERSMVTRDRDEKRDHKIVENFPKACFRNSAVNKYPAQSCGHFATLTLSLSYALSVVGRGCLFFLVPG